jgi:hypothetical protein
MPLGISIRVYLADGTVTGIRHAEVVNWTGQALSCPRLRIAELGEWDEARRPGVYLLFGTDDTSDRPAVYIGEAENVFDRLQSHLSQKDFWTEIVLFSNKDENLTKAHVRYLEQNSQKLRRQRTGTRLRMPISRRRRSCRAATATRWRVSFHRRGCYSVFSATKSWSP